MSEISNINADLDDAESEQSKIRLRLKEIEENLFEMEKEAERLYPGTSKSHGSRKNEQNNLIMRHLLILFKGQKMRKYRTKIGEQLSFILIQKNGLLSFIRATCDFDSSSEVKTTFDQRFRALSTIITHIPAICCDLEDYYSHLSTQIIHLLALPSNDDVNKLQWKLAALIFIGLYNKKSTYGETKLLRPILDSFIDLENSYLSLHESLLCIHRLLVSDFDKNSFIPLFPRIFAIFLVLHGTVSPLKASVKEIVIDLLKYVDHSLYLLDDALFINLNFIHLFKTGLVKYGNEEIVTIIFNPKSEQESKIDLKFLDAIVQATLVLLDELGNEFKLDAFLLFLDRVHESVPNQLLLFSLIDSLQEQISDLILDYPSKGIQFITNALRRTTTDRNDSIYSLMNQEDVNIEEENQIAKNAQILHMDSLSMLIQIFSILLEAKDKLTKNEILSIKECNVYLSRIVSSKDLANSEKLKIQSLINEINDLSESSISTKNSTDDKFNTALRCLNSNFMPQRAHGLVVLRNLIDSRHPSTIDQQAELFTLIKACLSDSDSYVYLAAVNALSSLALAHTDTCLPTLIEAFHDKIRSIRERVSVGESLVWVCKYLGQLAHHYYRPVIYCFLVGLKDEDESIRVSSLSNLAQFCSSLKNALNYCIIEVISAVECLLKTDSSLDVKRACLMFLHIMLNGIDNRSIEAIHEHLKTIYHIIKSIDSRSLGDDIIRIHAHLSLEAIDNHVKNLIKPPEDMIRQIRMK